MEFLARVQPSLRDWLFARQVPALKRRAIFRLSLRDKRRLNFRKALRLAGSQCAARGSVSRAHVRSVWQQIITKMSFRVHAAAAHRAAIRAHRFPFFRLALATEFSDQCGG
jgi:hypothetical protein